MDGPATERLRCEGVAWEVVRAERGLLEREVLTRIGELDELATAEQVKRTVRRTLYRVGLSDGRTVLVKVFRAKHWRDRLVRAVLPCRATHEWRASRRLAAMGIPASRAVAVGHPVGWRWDVLAWLVIGLEPDVVPLGACIRRAGGEKQESHAGDAEAAEQAENQGRTTEAAEGESRQELVAAAARFVRRLHDAGVRQDDLHGGNLLVRRGEAAEDERLVLIDLQRVRFGRPPRPRRRARAVAQLLNGLPEEVDGARTVDLFLAVYHGDAPLFGSGHLTPAALHREMERLAAVRLRSRAKRCLVNSSRFAVETLGGWRLYHRRAYPAADLVRLVEEHREALARPPHTVTCPHAGPEGEVTLELTWHPPPSALHRLLGRLLPSPGVRAYAEAHRRQVTGEDGPAPVAALMRRGESVTILEQEAPGDVRRREAKERTDE
ncbi:MAG: lipopolysaccharide kinase InaA family protein [Planctomycetota bacterium]